MDETLDTETEINIISFGIIVTGVDKLGLGHPRLIKSLLNY